MINFKGLLFKCRFSFLPSLWLERVRTKRVWQQLLKGQSCFLAFVVVGVDHGLGTEFHHHLPARSARGGWLIIFDNDNDLVKFHSWTFSSNCGDDGAPLCTDAGRVSGVLNVAPAVDLSSLGRSEGCTNLES